MTSWGRTTYEELRVALSHEERMRKAEELARHLAETERLRAERAELIRELSQQIKQREQEQQALARDVVLGSEERPVACFEQPRFSERLVDIVRADTHEVLRTRAMQPDERQQPMQFSREDEDDEDDAPPSAH